MKRTSKVLLGIAATVAAKASADTITPAAGSTTVTNGGTTVVDPVVWWADMGEYFGNGRAYVVPVQLPTLPSGASFGTADIAFGHHGPNAHPVDGRTGFFGGSAPNYNVDLYGLSRIAASDAVLDVDHFSGPSDASNALLQDDFMDPASPGNRTVVSTDAAGDTALAGWLNTMYAGGANAGQYVFLRLNPDGIEGTLPWSGYQVMTSLAGGADEMPVLTYTVVPEPAALSLIALGCVVLRRRA